MATRYYPAPKATGVVYHGELEGDWADYGAYAWRFGPVHQTYELSQDKATSGESVEIHFASNQSPNFDQQCFRWVTPPLAEQTLSGTFDLCVWLQYYWATLLTITDSSVIKLKFHSYIAVGQTTEVRTVLIDNYIGPEFPYIDAPGAWTSFEEPQAVAGEIEDGDVIVHELGIRYESMPTPTPTYPPSDNSHCQVIFTGGGDYGDFADAVAGETTQDRSPWWEYSDTLTEKAVVSPPANDACADAIVITDEYYVSDYINTTQAADVDDRTVWWKGTPTRSGILFLSALGSNYNVGIHVYTGDCDTLVELDRIDWSSRGTTGGRSMSSTTVEVESGIEYFMKVRNYYDNFQTIGSGGALRLSVFFRETPVEDDLYIPNSTIYSLREGLFVNMNAIFQTSKPTGVGIDYTERPMTNWIDPLQINTSHRLLVAQHDGDTIDILDLPTLSIQDEGSEIDSIHDPFRVIVDFETVAIHPAQLNITTAGMIYSGWFGNGYLMTVGQGGSGGGIPAIYNAISDVPAYTSIKSIDATHGDNQAGAPYSDTEQVVDLEFWAPWANTYDEDSGILYYASGGYYSPTGELVETIQKYDITNSIQLADFATVTLSGTSYNPGLKGMRLLPDGGLIVCNGNVVNRLNSSGSIIHTYTPSVEIDSRTLIDVELTADRQSFWVFDGASTRLFKFGVDSGTELMTVQPYGAPDLFVQMIVYEPEGPPPPTDNTFSGVYKIVPGKRQDTLWEDLTTRETRDVKIPDPFVKTAYLGE